MILNSQIVELTNEVKSAKMMDVLTIRPPRRLFAAAAAALMLNFGNKDRGTCAFQFDLKHIS
jgi:hypothetical protein